MINLFSKTIDFIKNNNLFSKKDDFIKRMANYEKTRKIGK